MAILDAVKGLEVWVKVDGERAEEYWDPADVPASATEVRRYIEGVPGKTFSVHEFFKQDFEPKDHAQRVITNIDGILEDRGIISAEDLQRANGWKSYCDGVRQECQDGDIMYRDFQFHDLNIVEEDVTSDELRRFKEALKDVGSITWTCRAVNVTKSDFKVKKGSEHVEQYDHGEIPWKAANNMQLSHSVGLSPGFKWRNEPSNWLTTEDVNPDGPPMATFKFCYRSKDVLRGLKSCSLEPPPAYRKPAEDMTQEELQGELDGLANNRLQSRVAIGENSTATDLNVPDLTEDVKEENADTITDMTGSHQELITMSTDGPGANEGGGANNNIASMTDEELENEIRQLRRQALEQAVLELRADKKRREQDMGRKRQQELRGQNGNVIIDLTIDD